MLDSLDEPQRAMFSARLGQKRRLERKQKKKSKI